MDDLADFWCFENSVFSETFPKGILIEKLKTDQSIWPMFFNKLCDMLSDKNVTIMTHVFDTFRKGILIKKNENWPINLTQPKPDIFW